MLTKLENHNRNQHIKYVVQISNVAGAVMPIFLKVEKLRIVSPDFVQFKV